MKRDEAQKLLQIVEDELGGIPHGHQTHVLNAYAELYGFDDGQLVLTEPHGREFAVPRGTLRQAHKARRFDPPSSQRASLDNAPRRESQRHRIIELMATIQVGKAWLAEEIADQLGIPLNSISTRMSELVAGGWVGDAGPKRETRHGEPATTYVPTKKTLDHFREEVERALVAA
jgi:hypothetical protein